MTKNKANQEISDARKEYLAASKKLKQSKKRYKDATRKRRKILKMAQKQGQSAGNKKKLDAAKREYLNTFEQLQKDLKDYKKTVTRVDNIAAKTKKNKKSTQKKPANPEIDTATQELNNATDKDLAVLNKMKERSEGYKTAIEQIVEENPQYVLDILDGKGKKKPGIKLNKQLKKDLHAQISPFSGFGQRKGGKTGGIHKSDVEGGIYKKDGKTFLIKRDIKKEQNDIGEYLAAQIFNTTAPGSACKLSLVKSDITDKPFLASQFIDNYQDFHKVVGYERDGLHTAKESFEALLNLPQPVKKGLKKQNKEGKYVYSDLEKNLVSSLLVGDFSVHSGNFGVVGDEEEIQKKKNNPKYRYKKGKLARIDFGAAFRKLTPEINPNKSLKNRLGLEKNYFLRDQPKERVFTRAFAEELANVANKDLSKTIDKTWKEIEANYSSETIEAFGKQIGSRSKNPEKIKAFLTKRMTQRQQSLKDMAAEIYLEMAQDAKTLQLDQVKKAVAISPEHCKKILRMKNPAKKTQLKIEPIGQLKEALKSELTKAEKINKSVEKPTKSKIQPKIKTPTPGKPKAKVQVQPPAPNKPKSKVINTATTKKADIGKSNKTEPKTQTPSKIIANDVVQSGKSPIAKAIRTEVIEKQNNLIQQLLSKHIGNPDTAKQISELKPDEFSKILKLKDTKALLSDILKDKNIRKNFTKEIHQVEVAGYQKVHNQFKKDFKNVDWQQDEPKADQDKNISTRSTEIRNENGSLACTLAERTTKNPLTIKVDGKEHVVKSHRFVGFPEKLKGKSSGPMDMSMALRDEKGNNMPRKGAVYYTAHYDKEGKLVEVSSPKPVKFNGKGDDAVGYIERDGKIYTLPVTRGKHREMMREVAKNKGQNIDISQTKEKEQIKTEKTKENLITPKETDEKTKSNQKPNRKTEPSSKNKQNEKQGFSSVNEELEYRMKNASVNKDDTKNIASKIKENVDADKNKTKQEPQSQKEYKYYKAEKLDQPTQYYKPKKPFMRKPEQQKHHIMEDITLPLEYHQQKKIRVKSGKIQTIDDDKSAKKPVPPNLKSQVKNLGKQIKTSIPKEPGVNTRPPNVKKPGGKGPKSIV